MTSVRKLCSLASKFEVRFEVERKGLRSTLLVPNPLSTLELADENIHAADITPFGPSMLSSTVVDETSYVFDMLTI